MQVIESRSEGTCGNHEWSKPHNRLLVGSNLPQRFETFGALSRKVLVHLFVQVLRLYSRLDMVCISICKSVVWMGTPRLHTCSVVHLRIPGTERDDESFAKARCHSDYERDVSCQNNERTCYVFKGSRKATDSKHK